MKEHRIGVLLLQETHLTDDRVKAIHDMFARKIRIFHSMHGESPTQKEGVAVVLNARFIDTAAAEMTEILPGRAMQVAFECPGGETKHVLCVYAPTSDGISERERFFKELTEYYESHPALPKPQVMAGDFNNIEDPIDRLPVGDGPDSSVLALDDLKLSLGMMLADGWRATYPNTREYTFHRGTGRNAVFSRLDRFYVNPSTFDNAREWGICEAGVRTDHSLIKVQLTPERAPVLGPGRPTFPLHCIKDKILTKQTKRRGIEAIRELNDLEAANGRNALTNPQTILRDFKTAAMKLARERERAVVPKLLAEIRDRESMLRRVKANRALPDCDKIAEAAALTEQVRQLKQQRYKQQQQNSRATHRLYGDRPTKYWSKLHRECAPRDVINAFEREGQLGTAGEKIYECDSTRMAEMARTHHMNVQRDDATVKPPHERQADITIALDSLETKVNEAQSEELGKEISYEECVLSLRFAKNGTSPGLDGVPFEFWKSLHARYIEDSRFTNREHFDVMYLLRAAFEDIRLYGVDPKTRFASGWIAPIYKEKGERTRVVNYRPITLLNTDYKLLSKTLAVRLADVAPDIIHKAQAGFVPGRKIHNHTQLARMMMLWAEKHESNGAIVALDQEKAYDKVAHDYLWKVLERFGIPASFIKLTQSLYTNAATSVMINGVLSKAYRVYRGVRQGDPLSCLLFDLAIEPLSAMIRKSELEGFDIPRCGQTLKAVLFADDTTVYLSSRDDFQTLQTILDTWCSAAKARFNIGKTEIIPIGSETFRKEMAETYRDTGGWRNYPRNVHVAQEGEAVRILGAFFGNGTSQAGIWTLVLTKIVAMRKPLMEVIARWKTGHATLHGKRHVIQMIIGGMTQYLTTVQRMPEEVLTRLNKIIRGFLWNDRRSPPVSLEHVHLPVAKGGLNILDLEARNEAIDIMWLKAYLNLGTERPLWAYLADDLLAGHVTKDCRPQRSELRVNPLLQRWKPKTRGLPAELDGMMKVSRKYGVRLEGLAFSRAILKDMPLWDHAHADKIRLSRLTVPSKLLTCLQDNHRARSVGDFLTLGATLEDATHKPRATCKCENCTRLKLSTHCKNPHRCAMRARDMLNTLPAKWDPRRRQPEDYETKEMEDLRHEGLSEDLIPFDRRVTTHGSLGNAFRIFTSAAPASDEAVTTSLDEDGTNAILATDGSCLYNGEMRAQAGAGVFVEHDQSQNRSVRLPKEIEQTNQSGEVAATLIATSLANGRTRVIQETDSQTTMNALTKWKQSHEDSGYILQTNVRLTRTTIAHLRMRSAHTLFRWVKGHSGHPRNEEADTLAAIGSRKPDGDPLQLEIPAALMLTGAKLQTITQKLAYRAIRKRKDMRSKPRPRTAANMERITSGIQAIYGVQLKEETVWNSFRSRHVTRQVSQFMWMTVHDAYMIGTHWLRPNMSAELQERAICTVCGECETMTHIIFECRAVGQELIWDLLRNTWVLTGTAWNEPIWGSTLGAACAVFTTPEGTRRTSIESLWTILCTEALHLIWKLRCERVIKNQGEEFTRNEVTNRYFSTMDSRLSLDRRTAAIAKGKKALKAQDVRRIWQPVLEDTSNLPTEWVTDSGVLVGIKRGR